MWDRPRYGMAQARAPGPGITIPAPQQGGYPTAQQVGLAPYPVSRRDTPEEGSGGSAIYNAAERRWYTLTLDDMRTLYEEEARKIGVRWGPQTELSPLVHSQITEIRLDRPAHPGIPVALNVDQPTQQLRFYFDDPTLIRRVTATVGACRLTPAGQPEPGFFFPSESDYVWARATRAGQGQVFMTQPMSLGNMSGNGGLPYFFFIIPGVQQGGTILIDLTIVPPGFPNGPASPPPFVERIGWVGVDLHCERFNKFGI